MSSLKSVVLTSILLTLALGTCLFLLWLYASLLDFFPWGDKKAYVIWELLVLYFIVPVFITVGCLWMLVSKSRSSMKIGLHLVIIGLAFTLPSMLGFDLESDLEGRWSGVFVSVAAVILIVKNMVNSIRYEITDHNRND